MIKKPILILLIVSLCVAGVLALLTHSVFSSAEYTVPSFEKVRANYRKSDAILLDRRHQVIQETRTDNQGRRLDWVSIGEVSPAMLSATIFAEDRRFYRHHGTDWRSVAGAVRDAFLKSSPRGASTITMQLASLVTGERKDDKRSLRRKWRQFQQARAIEKSWSKEQILEAYLNLVSFRGELQGIEAASRGLFGKDPHGLNDSESLILASLLRAPNASEQNVARRASALGSAMGLQPDRKDILSRVKRAWSRSSFIAPQANLAPHAAQLLLAPQQSVGRTGQNPAVQVVSTLDADLQSFANEALRRHLQEVAAQNVHDGALLAVENETGDVLAYVANTGVAASARYVDGVRAPRQAGSALKPFLYGLAFEKRLLTPASLIEDSPIEIPVSGGTYRPKNYDNQFNGLVTARIALASSLNVPAVRTLNMVGVESFVEKLKELGFRDLRLADFYGPSLALGSADITLWDLVNGYRAFSNNGMWSEMRLAPDKETRSSRKRVYSEQAAFLISNILSDRESRSRTFSLESPLSSRFWTAVKTGTSKDMRDNWCVGYSTDYTVGVWVGNFSGEPMWNVSGITGAAPVWIEVMNRLHRDKPSRPKSPPQGIIGRKTEFAEFGQTQEEWFIQGTETDQVRAPIGQAGCRIVYPVTATIFALDPDIPRSQQRLFFESQPRSDRFHWILNGEILGSAGSLRGWSPVPGKHILSLADDRNRTLDSVSFEVRGAAEKK